MARLIDADDLKKAVLDLDLDNSPYWLVVKAIDNSPTVTPDMAQVLAYESGKASANRPTGKWLEHWSKELSEKGFYQCSRCKAGFQRYERGTRHSELPWIDGQKYELHCIDNYCPNCGAKMKEAENET